MKSIDRLGIITIHVNVSYYTLVANIIHKLYSNAVNNMVTAVPWHIHWDLCPMLSPMMIADRHSGLGSERHTKVQ